MINEMQDLPTITTPVEFQYLKKLIDYRLGLSAEPEFPGIDQWSLPVKKYIRDNDLEKDKDTATLLLIGLAPHAFPELFDQAIQEKIKTYGDFPEIGGVRGKNFRGFLPTGQTAVFLLAGGNWERRSTIEQLFWSDKILAKKKILWLEELPQGEPVISGKITMAPDYIDLFLFESSAPTQLSPSLPVKRITTLLTPDDIIMNQKIKKHYKNLKEWIVYNSSLMEEWGMNKYLGPGYRVLYYGAPGSGKTLVATVLGKETGRDVYKIDLSLVVSKYIGETEKNLDLLFARAKDKGWILFFDEADAIFSKRSEVRDSHDRYANLEAAYLLQHMKEFSGLAILATNTKNNLDDAYIREFDEIVEFPIPSEEERKEIWERSFPSNSTFDDIPNRVRKFELTGGNIINAIHFAGIQALSRRNEQGEAGQNKLKFYLDDVYEGIKKEMTKKGKS